MTDPYTIQPNSGALTELRQRLFPEDITIAVMSHTAFAPAGRIRIGDAELVTYTGKAMSVSPRMPILTGCTRGADREQGGSGPREWNAATQVVQAPYERPELVSEMPEPTIDQAGRQVYLESREPELSFFSEGEGGSSQRDITTPEQLNAVHLSNFGVQGPADGEFDVAIRGITVSPIDDAVYVSSDDRVQKFTANGTFDSVIATAGSGDGEVSGPSGMVILLNGNLAVADTLNNRSQVFTPDGVFVSKSTSLPVGYNPTDVFLLSGTYAHEPSPLRVGVDSMRRLWVSNKDTGVVVVEDAGTERIVIDNPGSGRGQLSSPGDIAIDAQDNAYIADSGNHRIQVFDKNGIFQAMFGRFGDGDGEFNTPTAIAITDDYIYVTDSGNFRVQIFNNPAALFAQPLIIPFFSVAGNLAAAGNMSWSNMPAAETGLFGYGLTGFMRIVDLSRQSQIRLSISSLLAAAGSKLRLSYSPNGTSWTTLVDCNLSTDPTNVVSAVSAFVSLPAAARIETCYLRVTGLSGNSSNDPFIYNVIAEAR